MVELQVPGVGDAFSARRFGTIFLLSSGGSLLLVHLSDDFEARALLAADEGERVMVSEKGLAINGGRA